FGSEAADTVSAAVSEKIGQAKDLAKVYVATELTLGADLVGVASSAAKSVGWDISAQATQIQGDMKGVATDLLSSPPESSIKAQAAAVAGFTVGGVEAAGRMVEGIANLGVLATKEYVYQKMGGDQVWGNSPQPGDNSLAGQVLNWAAGGHQQVQQI